MTAIISVCRILCLNLLIFSPLFLFATNLYIATSDLNVRSGPGKKYSIVFTLKKGSEVEVLAQNGEWSLIKYSNRTGHVNSKYLANTANSKDEGYTPKSNHTNNFSSEYFLLLIPIAIWLFKRWLFERRRIRRRDYYRNVYLKSEDWQRKRYVVLQRDNWTCVYCGARATQVHHLRYAKYNIGNEPISWLVSVCQSCHEAQHR